MKRISLIITNLFFIFNIVSAQDTINDPSRKHRITIENAILLENNSLNADLFTSGNIDSYKHTISDGLQENNVLALQNRLGISYTKKAFNNKLGYHIGIYDRTELDFTFSKDLFDLIFFGNSMFMGDRIDLNNTSISATRFQQVNLSLSKIITLNSSNKFAPDELEIGLGYSYLIGNTHLGASIKDSYIDIGELGEYINTNLNLTAQISDTNDILKYNIMGQNGGGSSLDLMINLKKEEDNIHFSINDFGSINWKDNAVTYSANKLVNFSGIEIDDLLSINDSIIQNELDSLSNIDLVEKGETFRSYLSTTYHFAYKRDLPIDYIKYVTVGRISKHRRGIIPSNYKPKYYLGTLFYHRGFQAKTTYSIGGYSKHAWQMELGQNMFKRHFQLVLGTQHFESVFKGMSLSNVDLYFGLNFLF